jgi:cell division protein FtsQ
MLMRRRNKLRRAEPAALLNWQKLPWRKLLWSAASVAAAVLAGWAVLVVVDQPIEHVEVDGSLQHITAQDVEKAVRARLHGAGLITVNLDEVRRSLHSLPWVDETSVQRVWPRGLSVHVTEQLAVARWNQADLVNARGESFVSESRFVPPELPQLSGPPGTQSEVVARYLATNGRIVEAGMRLVAVHLDARGAWELLLDNGVGVRLGSRQIDERFERFADVALRLIGQRPMDIAYVDMRYTNGFAVGWRNGASRLAGTPETKAGRTSG